MIQMRAMGLAVLFMAMLSTPPFALDVDAANECFQSPAGRLLWAQQDAIMSSLKSFLSEKEMARFSQKVLDSNGQYTKMVVQATNCTELIEVNSRLLKEMDQKVIRLYQDLDAAADITVSPAR